MTMPGIVSTIGPKQFDWRFEDDGSVYLEGKKISAEVQRLSRQGVFILLGGKAYHVLATKRDLEYDILINGKSIAVSTEESTRQQASRFLGQAKHHASVTEVRSPMPGMVVRSEVQEGTAVRVGDGLLILEAMKMENEIRAAKEGVVKRILVAERQVVEKGELLLIIE